MSRLVLHSNKVVLPDGIRPATVVVENDKISKVVEGRLEDSNLEDFGDSYIMPGIIDSHVHINQPGRTDWEGFDTGTKAAAAGGITTLVDMPLNSSPVTVDAQSYEEKLKSVTEAHINFGLYGGLIPDNEAGLEEIVEKPILGMKCFLTHSGIYEFPNVLEEDLRKALPILKERGLVLLAHCEIESEGTTEALIENPESYQAYLASRPKEWENKAIEMMIGLAKEFDTRIHIVHLSSSEAIRMLTEARKEGVKVTVETCPQYLTVNAEDIDDGDTRFKCAPPIREKENNELLWKALMDGLIDFIVTDHSPAPPDIKELDSGNFLKAWGGISSIQHSWPLMWTAAKQRGFTVNELSNWMSTEVAKFLNLQDSKGSLKAGYDADITVWSDESFVLRKEDIEYRHKISPFEGKELFGKIQATIVNGSKVFKDGKFINLNQGKIIERNAK